jgi:hypothetical protein
VIRKEFRHSPIDGVVYSKPVYSSDGRTMTSAFDFDYSNRFIGIKFVYVVACVAVVVVVVVVGLFM